MAVSAVAAGPRQAALQNGTFLTASVVVALVALPILSIFFSFSGVTAYVKLLKKRPLAKKLLTDMAKQVIIVNQ